MAAPKPGDRLVMTTKLRRMAPRERSGTIERVLDPAQPRLEVRWDDGRLSTIAPLPDAFRIEPPAKKRKAKPKDEPYKPVTPTRQRLRAAPKRRKVRKT